VDAGESDRSEDSFAEFPGIVLWTDDMRVELWSEIMGIGEEASG
jgi:hypothetical protein